MRGQKAETAVEYKDVNLRRLRGRLWRLSSILTCGVLVITLAASWVASALTAREVNNAELANMRMEAHQAEDLIAAKLVAEDEALGALKSAYEREEADTRPFSEYRSSASVPDGNVEMGSPVNTSFSVMVFEDGSMTFAVPPRNVLSGDDGGDSAWNEWNVAKLVRTAIADREAGSDRMAPQRVELGNMTWQWTTWIFVANPNYDPEQPGAHDEVAVYPNGDLADYEKDGYVAARVFTFSDITPSVRQLERLAVVLVVAGVIGCALLVITCRKIIDRALVPVAESQARQREFLIKASHELKTPMASLSSNLDALVANGDETVASQDRWTANMRADIDELAARTCALLELVTSPDVPSDAPSDDLSSDAEGSCSEGAVNAASDSPKEPE